jgi:bis(5'-nucleosyl)-tetraphosphatase (symmetrical)
MAVYAIGDVQGCLTTLRTLLERIAFNPARDTLWFTGDLVDRGPESLDLLRFVKSLGSSAIVVLGNHDLHLLAVYAGAATARQHNTFKSILDAPDREALIQWLSTRPLLHHAPDLGFTLVHAGLLPQWDLAHARDLAREAEAAIATRADTFFPLLFGDLPDQWDNDLTGPDRWRIIINAFTRLRYCDRDGKMALRHNGSPVSKPSHLLPWFDVPGRKSGGLSIIFGHWSTLGLCRGEDFIALDSGCGWGGDLTAARIDVTPVEFYAVPGPKSLGSKSNTRHIFPVPNPEEASYSTSCVERVRAKMIEG